MAKLERKNFKVFGENAPLDEIGQFGSAKATTKKNTKDIEEIQELDAWSDGWGGAVISNKNYPPMEEMTGAMNVMSYQTAYTLQEGIPEWNKDTTYYKGSIVKNLEGKDVKLYQSISNDNLNNPLSNTDNWSEISFGTGLEVCDIGMALYVDESKGLRRYLNGQIVDINANTQAFLARLKQITTLYPSLLCTEDEWQTAKTMSKFGQVGKFVFNYADDGVTIVSVRIPRVVNVQGLFDLQNLGMTVAESLPNITGALPLDQFATTNEALNGLGAIYRDSQIGAYTTRSAAATGAYCWWRIDASRSSSTYQDNAPVQQEAIQYPYFIQIATGSETENNIINEIELNNPYSFGDSKYSPIELNNISWLASNGQWNAKATYPAYYDWILTNVNNGVDGFKLSTAEDITDYDWVINTSDETFRLPLLDGSEDIINYTTSKNLGASATFTAPCNGYIYNKVINSSGSYVCTVNGIEVISHVCNASSYNDADTIFVKKGDIFKSNYVNDANIFYKAQGNGSLYFYVGETVQNANLIDAGRIGEVLSTKTDKVQAAQASMPSSKYIDLTLGASDSKYTAPANGWFQLTKKASGTQWISIFNSTSNSIGTRIQVTNSNAAAFCPVIKGDVVTISYTVSEETIHFRFIYAQGDV